LRALRARGALAAFDGFFPDASAVPAAAPAAALAAILVN
jgi:hypothetical protein